MRNILIIILLSLALCSCNGFFDKDNTPTPSPLVNFAPEISVQNRWTTSVGSGVDNDYLKLSSTASNGMIFTPSADGTVAATDAYTGRTIWQNCTHVPISNGLTAHNGLVFMGSSEGDVIALRQCDGRLVWRALVSSEVLAPVTAGSGVVVVKSIDGKLTGLDEQTGHVLWSFMQSEPVLILRGASAPQISGNHVLVGFANGNLSKFTLHDGSLVWQQPIAIPQGCFTIQRMIDIDADPIIYNYKIYVGTYQGRIAALELSSGKMLWNHDISTYSGMAIDGSRVYVSDAKGHLWAFDRESGTVDWRQTQLEARNITGPVIMGNYVVVGDEQGYLHWICKQDGHFVARVRLDGSGILATPIVANNILYVVARDGKLAAYQYG